MLAQNFQSAEKLLITERQRQALIKTLTLLETNKLKHFPRKRQTFHIAEDKLSLNFTGQFNMDVWLAKTSCETVACIGGTAELVGQVDFGSNHMTLPTNLRKLFYPDFENSFVDYDDITVDHAAQALRNYLTTGKPCWHDVLSELLTY